MTQATTRLARAAVAIAMISVPQWPNPLTFGAVTRALLPNHRLQAQSAAALRPASRNGLPAAKPEDVGMSSERLRRVHEVVQRHIDAGSRSLRSPPQGYEHAKRFVSPAFTGPDVRRAPHSRSGLIV